MTITHLQWPWAANVFINFLKQFVKHTHTRTHACTQSTLSQEYSQQVPVLSCGMVNALIWEETRWPLSIKLLHWGSISHLPGVRWHRLCPTRQHSLLHGECEGLPSLNPPGQVQAGVVLNPTLMISCHVPWGPGGWAPGARFLFSLLSFQSGPHRAGLFWWIFLQGPVWMNRCYGWDRSSRCPGNNS